MSEVDGLVNRRTQLQKGLQEIKAAIQDSKKEIAICFIDLADSTSIKETMTDDEWLQYIYEFLTEVDILARQSNGEVIKRIGDEVMISFDKFQNSEIFTGKISKSSNLDKYKFKIGLDFGEVFYLKFESHLKNDPYGSVVDRCARIAGLSKSGIMTCSDSYYSRVKEKSSYIILESVKLKGISGACTLYATSIFGSNSEEYTRPLRKAIEDSVHKSKGFKTYFGAPSHKEIVESQNSVARPFMAIGLLNIPTLPISFRQLATDSRGLDLAQKREKYIGYGVEWTLQFKSFKKQNDHYIVLADPNPKSDFDIDGAEVILPLFWRECLEMIRGNPKIVVKGVITDVFFRFVVNYADIMILED